MAKVRCALLSLSKSIGRGNRVIFDADGSYIEYKKTGERTNIERKNGVFTMKLWVAPKPMAGYGDARTLAPYVAGEANGPGGQRSTPRCGRRSCKAAERHGRGDAGGEWRHGSGNRRNGGRLRTGGKTPGTGG